MKVYPDASLIVSAFVEEASSRRSAAFLHELSPGDLLTSWWTETEIVSALGVKSRVGAMTATARSTVLLAIRAMIRASATIVTPIAEDFRVASDLIERSTLPLRGGDALHLAVASRNAAICWTLDRRVVEAGQALGLGTRLLA